MMHDNVHYHTFHPVYTNNTLKTYTQKLKYIGQAGEFSAYTHYFFST